MAYTLIDTDPEPESVRRLTLVPFRADGTCLALPTAAGLTLPTGEVAAGEHWLLEATLRIPLQSAGFRYQRVHPVARDGDHLFVWIEGADGYRGDRPHAEVELVAGSAEEIAARVDRPQVVRDAARSYREQSEDSYYADNLRLLEPAYLRAATAEGGAGVGGSPEQWRRGRESIVDGIDRDGTFCDVGCANGLLMESVQGWAAERGIAIEPWGVDVGPELVALARRRLPHWAGRIHVGNAIDWTPPDGRRFTFVHGLFDFWPVSRRRAGVSHLLSLVEPGGRLLMSDYGTGDAAAVLRALGFDPVGASARTAWLSAD